MALTHCNYTCQTLVADATCPVIFPARVFSPALQRQPFALANRRTAVRLLLYSDLSLSPERSPNARVYTYARPEGAVP